LIAKDDVVHQGAIRIKAVELSDDGAAGEAFYVSYELAKTARIDEFWLTVSP
jgi:hypothetical protein